MVLPTAQSAAAVSGGPALSARAPQGIPGRGRGQRNGHRVSGLGDGLLDALQTSERKQAGTRERSLFPLLLGEVVDELNSEAFVHWLSQLTGIPELLSDDMLEGGGLHQSGAGGFLSRKR